MILSQGIYVSIELAALYKWIETNSFYDDVCGCRHVIYIHRISYGIVGVIVSVRTIWKSYFFTDELKNCDNMLRYWFYSKDCELATEIKQ